MIQEFFPSMRISKLWGHVMTCILRGTSEREKGMTYFDIMVIQFQTKNGKIVLIVRLHAESCSHND